MTQKLESLLEQLRIARQDRGEAMQIMKSLLDAVRDTAEFKAAEAQAQAAEEQAKKFTEQIVTWGKTYYVRKAGDKHPHPLVEIKVFRIPRITRPNLTREWAWKKHPEFLLFDEEKIGKYAKEIGEVPGVVIEDDPRVYIAKDLSKIGEES